VTVADLQAIVARVKNALASSAPAPNHSPPPPPSLQPDGHRAELVSHFARELEAVAARVVGPVTPEQLAERVRAIVRERGVKSIAVGEGVLVDLSQVGKTLSESGIDVIRTASVDGSTRPELRRQLAHVDAGLAEADYAIASTGTLAVLSDETRPSALTLLPPASMVVVRVDRIKADLASALTALGGAALELHRLTLITGPSRTADIEKRIVMGVHGPKSLDVIVVWPRDD
jgi:L-lactate dehydrogenase complex protein LldG